MIEALDRARTYLELFVPSGALENYLAAIGWALVAQVSPMTAHSHPGNEAAEILAGAVYEFFQTPSGEAMEKMRTALTNWISVAHPSAVAPVAGQPQESSEIPA